MVCVASTLCILIFSTKELRLNYMMYLALSVGDLINGASFVAAGVFRNVLMFNGRLFEETNGMNCLFKTPWAVLMLVAGQYPAMINLFIALERIAALQFSTWYRVFWREHYKIYLVLIVLVVLAFVINAVQTHILPNRVCAVMDSTGIVYGTIHYGSIAFAYLCSFIALATTFLRINRSLVSFYRMAQNGVNLYFERFQTPSKDEVRRQRMMLAINAISVLLVSVPNTVVILSEWKSPKFSDLMIG
ncbi:unnamed protein product [Nippostrongylus brasiliensis]|uniref:G_PROTEIN_RECEP_F1_2 domain-containing protein n=1 Tax=Nippostrongylus brasiliensis TaxID=27835 RepID=A0A0N4XGF7_NIPBR|nr:unnamed protein product [Nippostrongylus brasiliensis]